MDAGEAIERVRTLFNDDGFTYRKGPWKITVGRETVGKTLTTLDMLKPKR